MRKLIFAFLMLAVAANAFAHAGEVHKYMGTVTAVHDGGAFTLKKTDGESMRVEVSKATVYRYANGSAAPPTELAAGRRVVVTISVDGKTATEIKFAARKS